ncbi:MAG: hypothetical protein MRY49_03350 [Candidatus Pacebacteria bacterium]|nr:hypothetical protein [Candidatus Paceibacterota bacterium]
MSKKILMMLTAMFWGGFVGGFICQTYEWPKIAGILIGGTIGALSFKPKEVWESVKESFTHAFEAERWKKWWKENQVGEKICSFYANTLNMLTVVVGVWLLFGLMGGLVSLSSNGSFSQGFGGGFAPAIASLILGTIGCVAESFTDGRRFNNTSLLVFNPIVGPFVVLYFACRWIVHSVCWLGRRAPFALSKIWKGICWLFCAALTLFAMFAHKVDTHERRTVFVSSSLGVLAGCVYQTPYMCLICGTWSVLIGTIIIGLSKIVVKYTPDLARA